MGLTVLVVDDSSVMRAMVIKTLRASGVPLGEVRQAGNGAEGLAALRVGGVDLVLLDLNMPVMDGEAMIDAVRGDAALMETPIIVVSTESSASRVAALQEKAVEFVHKPFVPETLRDVIVRLVGAHRLDAEAGA